MNKITLTRSEAESLKDFIEYNFIQSIRDDIDMDSMVYLCNIVSIYKKITQAEENDDR